MSEAVTLTLAESGTIEEAANEAITDAAFVPQAPYAGVVPAYNAGTTYAKGALSQEGGVVYRSQVAGNKGHEPKADADFTNWAPQPVENYLLQNPALLTAPAPRTQQAHNNKPPARSDAAAAPLETIGIGAETPV